MKVTEIDNADFKPIWQGAASAGLEQNTKVLCGNLQAL